MRIRLQINPELRTAPLYKYLEAHHARSMVQEGIVRVTTLYDCRRVELGIARADATEATQDRIIFVDDLTVSADDDSAGARLVNNYWPAKNGTRHQRLTIEDARGDAPDRYIYCTSERFDAEVMRHDFRVDACVRIDNPFEFVGRLTHALAHCQIVQPDDAVMDRCVYGPRSGHHDQLPDVDLQWLKPPEYWRQREVRVQWEPRSRPIEPFLFRLDSLREVCSIHYLPGMDEPSATDKGGA